MKKFFFALLLSAYCLLPSAGLAANVGFVPSTGLWFSRDSFFPKETIRIYTVVVNNEYASMDGVVVFYDNSDIIDTVEIKGLPKEGAKLMRVFWEPTEGEHAVSARFIKAVAVDEKGARQDIDLATINSVAGAPLSVSTGQVMPVVSNDAQKVTDQLAAVGGAVNTGSSKTTALSEVQLVVKREGDKLALTAPEKTATASSATPPVERGGDEKPSLEGGGGSADPFAKNREILQKAENVAGTITSTAGKIESAYDKTKSAVEKGKEAYAEGQRQLLKIQPYLKKFEPYWNKLSNNNEPKRVAIIVVVMLVGIWMIKRAIRPKFYRNYGKYSRFPR